VRPRCNYIAFKNDLNLLRTGLIQARLTGVRNATQDMIVFLDAHCECTPHWLEPLAAQIKVSRKNVAVPFIDNIIARTFEYDPLELDESVRQFCSDVIIYEFIEFFQTGGFSWDGYFTWNGIPNREMLRLFKVCGSQIGSCPIETPTMVGGLFAMDRVYFWELGSYDEQVKKLLKAVEKN
jgi:polypeptide N-acetylgalactosaminyltransferase